MGFCRMGQVVLLGEESEEPSMARRPFSWYPLCARRNLVVVLIVILCICIRVVTLLSRICIVFCFSFCFGFGLECVGGELLGEHAHAEDDDGVLGVVGRALADALAYLSHIAPRPEPLDEVVYGVHGEAPTERLQFGGQESPGGHHFVGEGASEEHTVYVVVVCVGLIVFGVVLRVAHEADGSVEGLEGDGAAGVVLKYESCAFANFGGVVAVEGVSVGAAVFDVGIDDLLKLAYRVAHLLLFFSLH